MGCDNLDESNEAYEIWKQKTIDEWVRNGANRFDAEQAFIERGNDPLFSEGIEGCIDGALTAFLARYSDSQCRATAYRYHYNVNRSRSDQLISKFDLVTT